MQNSGKVVVVSQHYPPDPSTTAAIVAAISERVAQEAEVLVLSGTAGSATAASAGRVHVIEIKNRMPGKAALLKRALAELLFTARTFVAMLARLRRGDVTLTVPAPFMLPYAFAVAAKLKGARSVLIMHDLYPDVLVMAGLLKPKSLLAKAMHAMNAPMFRALDAVVIIGRDTEKLLLRYGGMTRDKIHFIPNWATLAPGVRPITPDNPFRRALSARYVVGLSGNLGFTHDSVVVFEAARLLRDNSDIHFLLSGWGVGFDQLKSMQDEVRLPNVTLVDRVEDEQLETFLSAANAWIIPYRKNVAGVSVPSRFYNLLAIGRPVILVSEADAEAALTVTEHDIGWVVTPGRADELADVIRRAAGSDNAQRAERATQISRRFDFNAAMASYCELIRELVQKRPN
ncbi:glycosyltransferase family 4 protein [Bradyrhizobium australiense]|uniref:Glycosyltransferase family 4 protein n=1 Tax=Bradyrhizobium australiense TaxID=2721161 RepID=A0A7Y4GXK3_9BRAD|nr:glycosyltransferase family 4 protein [Bradyrhizobium australiense]NOJ43806.1 glycosyltransferase family 4 protein [Bradyrhizobium australiense]